MANPNPQNQLSRKGRPKGARNKRTIEFLETLEENAFNPAQALIDCYTKAITTYNNYGTIYEAICEARDRKNDTTSTYSAPPEDCAHKYLKIAADTAKDIANYVYPKLKSIDYVKSDPLKDMTPEQKLEAMKHACIALELQIKAKESGNG